jgi:hypothetical protein
MKDSLFGVTLSLVMAGVIVEMPTYLIRVKGRLPADIGLRFEGMCVAEDDNGDGMIHSAVRDQSQLHGILDWLRDMNVTLLAVTQTAEEQSREGANPL